VSNYPDHCPECGATAWCEPGCSFNVAEMKRWSPLLIVVAGIVALAVASGLIGMVR
jgi:hypothetical protein